MYATYAYHKGLTPRTTLAAGFLAGITSVSFDASKIQWGSLDPNDPAVGYNNGEISKLKPELGAGLWLYSVDFFAGVSVLNIIPGKCKFCKRYFGQVWKQSCTTFYYHSRLQNFFK